MNASHWGVYRKNCHRQRVVYRESLQKGTSGEKTGNGIFSNWTFRMKELITQYCGVLIKDLNQYVDPNFRPEYTVEYRYKILNGYGIQGHHIPKNGLGSFVQRVNNGQTPNAEIWFDRKDGSIWIRALRTIFPGEEILVCYGEEYRMKDYCGISRPPIDPSFYEKDNKMNVEFIKNLKENNKKRKLNEK